MLCDRRPSMALYPPPFPWLSKPAVVRAATESIVASANSAHAPVGYLDYAGATTANGEPFWIKPSGREMIQRIELRQDEAPEYDAPDDGITRGLDFLGRFRAELSSGTFVFVISDFLGPPIDESTWLTAAARRWEVVPVVIQDLVWEQSFPADRWARRAAERSAATGEMLEARVSRREALRRRRPTSSGVPTLARRPLPVSASTLCCSRRACPKISTGRSSTGPSAGAI